MIARALDSNDYYFQIFDIGLVRPLSRTNEPHFIPVTKKTLLLFTLVVIIAIDPNQAFRNHNTPAFVAKWQKRISASSRRWRRQSKALRREAFPSVRYAPNLCKQSLRGLELIPCRIRSMSSQQGRANYWSRPQHAGAERQCDFTCKSDVELELLARAKTPSVLENQTSEIDTD